MKHNKNVLVYCILVGLLIGIIGNLWSCSIASNINQQVDEYFKEELKTYKVYSKDDKVKDPLGTRIDIVSEQALPLTIQAVNTNAKVEINKILLTSKHTSQQNYVEVKFSAELLEETSNIDENHHIKYLVLNENNEIMVMGTLCLEFDESGHVNNNIDSITDLNSLHQYKLLICSK